MTAASTVTADGVTDLALDLVDLLIELLDSDQDWPDEWRLIHPCYELAVVSVRQLPDWSHRNWQRHNQTVTA